MRRGGERDDIFEAFFFLVKENKEKRLLRCGRIPKLRW